MNIMRGEDQDADDITSGFMLNTPWPAL